MTLRTERVGERLRAEIARVLREDVKDPRLRLVTLTRVDVSPDLGNAIVFWSAMDVEDAGREEAVAAGLEAAAGYVRRQVAHSLPLRRTPALRFRHDPSLALGGRTLSVLRSLGEAEHAGKHGGDDEVEE